MYKIFKSQPQGKSEMLVVDFGASDTVHRVDKYSRPAGGGQGITRKWHPRHRTDKSYRVLVRPRYVHESNPSGLRPS